MNVAFAAGSGDGSTRCLDFIIFEEGVIEPDETIFITMALLTTGRNAVLGNATTTLILVNNGGKFVNSVSPPMLPHYSNTRW